MAEQQQQRASLNEFIEAARSQGASDQFLADLLERRGWPRKEIYRAFGEFYERLTGLELPARSSGLPTSARDAFLYLLSFGTLGTWTCGLGSLVFTLIDRWIPDALAHPAFAYNPNREISGSMASLIVAFPVYLLAMQFLIREAASQPEKLESGVRKWLTYLALLIAASVVIGDLITFLTYFLQGDLTARFILKVLTAGIIAGGVFWYYLLWLERPVERRPEYNND